MTVHLKPLGSRVVVEALEDENMTASGLVLPETARERPQKGTIVAAGPGGRGDDGQRVALDVVVGETVLFARYAGAEFKVDSKKLLILQESDLLARVDTGEGPKPKSK